MAIALPFYNLFVGLGVALAAALFHRRLSVFFDDARTRDRAMLLLIAALPSAAIGSWLFDRIAGASHGPILPLRGLAFAGGLIGALVAVVVTAAILAVPLLRVLDAGAPCIALGHAIGRIGCGVAGCCFGRHVDRGLWHSLGFHRVPTQWLESLALFVITAALLAIPARRDPARRDGHILAAYFAAYGVLRFVLETQRDDPRGALPILPHVFTPSQWIALAMVSIAIALGATRERTAAHA